MNIFILDNDMNKSAEYTVDAQVNKMTVEQTQILSTVYYIHSQPELAPYKKTHQHNRFVKWCAESLDNWLWLKEYTLILAAEYTYRYGKIHKCEGIVKSMILPDYKPIGITKFPQAMPDKYKNDDVVKAYRDYYLGEKTHLFKWKNRGVPEWITISLTK